LRVELEAKDKRIAELEAIKAAAEKLVRCKGRYHSEQNYRALAALFGVTTPDLPPVDGDNREVQPGLSRYYETAWKDGYEVGVITAPPQREARPDDKPFGYYSKETAAILERRGFAPISANPLVDHSIPLYTTPPAPAVPDGVMPGGLVYSSALPKFESNDSDKIVGYCCFISGETRSVESQEQAYADAKAVINACRSAMLAAKPENPRLVSYSDDMTTCTLNYRGEEYYFDLKSSTNDEVPHD